MPEHTYLPTTEIDQFKQEGFLLKKNLFNKLEMDNIKKWVQEIEAYPEVIGKYWRYYEKSLIEEKNRLLSRIENFSPDHQEMNSLINKSKMVTIVSELLGEQAVLFKEKINFKMPGGNGFTPHQDMQAGWNTYANFYITVLLSIDESNVENGCLEVAPGYHNLGLIGEMWKPLTENEIKDMKFIPIATQPGDAIFFDCYIPHRSQPNFSNSPRRILYLTYNRLNEGNHREQYYTDKYKNYPPDIEREANKEYVFKV
ncbi:phytanoyl-CoA dioxygenase family protein [Tolypothrix sp. PCC 7910]|nr:phytanoyl-CoA dioxygenase family protein [Tolypothrix sp. PCC 7910]